MHDEIRMSHLESTENWKTGTTHQLNRVQKHPKI